MSLPSKKPRRDMDRKRITRSCTSDRHGTQVRQLVDAAIDTSASVKQYAIHLGLGHDQSPRQQQATKGSAPSTRPQPHRSDRL